MRRQPEARADESALAELPEPPERLDAREQEVLMRDFELRLPGLLAAFFFLADFANRTHLLLFLSVLALYWMIGLGLLAISAHQSRNIQLVLRMLEEVANRSAERP